MAFFTSELRSLSGQFAQLRTAAPADTQAGLRSVRNTGGNERVGVWLLRVWGVLMDGGRGRTTNVIMKWLTYCRLRGGKEKPNGCTHSYSCWVNVCVTELKHRKWNTHSMCSACKHMLFVFLIDSKVGNLWAERLNVWLWGDSEVDVMWEWTLRSTPKQWLKHSALADKSWFINTFIRN